MSIKDKIIFCSAFLISVIGGYLVLDWTFNSLKSDIETAIQTQKDEYKDAADKQAALDQLFVSKQSTKLLIDNATFKVAQLENNHDWVGVNLELSDLVKLQNHRGDIDNQIIKALQEQIK